MSELLGQMIGNYRLDALLGSGGMGRVYRGVHLHLGREVAVKVLHEHLAADPGFRARFVQEAKAAAALSHPHIVEIFDFGEHQGQLYLVMELAAGGSLRTLLQQRASAGQPLSLSLGGTLVLQAAEALQHAHSRGMVHRDVKPDNLLLHLPPGQPAQAAQPAGYAVKIADFGLARLLENGAVTITGMAVGTPAYISPEQCLGQDLDGRSDLYSLGIVLYEVATGYLPFEVKTLSEAWDKHVHTPPPPPREVRPDLSAEIERVILRCLAKNPPDRYATANDLVEALRAALGPGMTPSSVGTRLASPPALASPAAASPAPTPSVVSPPGPPVPASPAPAPNVSAPAHAGLPSGKVAGTPPASAAQASNGVMRNGHTPAAAAGATALRPRLLVADERGQLQPPIDLRPGRLIAGRQSDCDVLLPDPLVSRRHLAIDWNGKDAAITDLGSGNGTWLGDVKLPRNTVQPWTPGSDLAVGPFRLRLDLTGEANAGAQTVGAVELNQNGAPSRARLLVVDKAGKVQRQIDIEKAGLAIGRSRQNDIVLPAQTVSGRHLRFAWDGHRATVTDLDSDNGTWLRGAKLTPNQAHAWPAGERLRVGPFWLRLEAPAAAQPSPPSPAMLAQPTALGRVQLLLEQQTLSLIPGQPAVLRGTLANLGTTVDHMFVTVEGVPKSWVAGDALRTGNDVEVQLYPGDQATIELTVTVPRVAESHAGEYRVTLLAHSRENAQELGVASAVWTVERFTGSALGVDPLKASGRRRAGYVATLANLGNAVEEFRLSATDDEHRLAFQWEQSAVAVEPGKTADVPLKARASWHWIGEPRTYPFGLHATSSDGAPPAATNATFVQRALVPPLVPRLLALAGAIGAIALMLLGLLLPLFQPRIESLSVEPPSPVAGQAVTVRWNVRRAETVSLKGIADGLDPAARQFTMADGLADQKELTLIATNRFGKTEDSLPVTVATLTPTPTATSTATPAPTETPVPLAPVIELFSVDPPSIAQGERVTVKWRVRNADSVTIEGLSTSPLGPEGELPHRPDRTTIYVLVASNRATSPIQTSREVIVRTPTPSPTPPATATPGPPV